MLDSVTSAQALVSWRSSVSSESVDEGGPATASGV